MGEMITRGTIWLALLAWFIVEATRLTIGIAEDRRNWLLWLWTFGCLAYVAHVVAAFAFYHHWSHAAAFEHTARVTAAMTGWRSGLGLWINYLFTGLWVAEVSWWWLDPGSHASQRRFAGIVWRGFIFFIVFNATVVFGHGPVRWFGAAACALLVALFLMRLRSLRVSREPLNR